MKIKITSILTLLLFCFPAFSQNDSQTEQKSKIIEIYFDLDSYAIDINYLDNDKNLSTLSSLIDHLQRDTLATISRIEINSYASPDGGLHYNEQISQKRTQSIYNYFRGTTTIPENILYLSYSGIDWKGLQQIVENSSMSYKSEVLQILESAPEEIKNRMTPYSNNIGFTSSDTVNKQLTELKDGEPYRYMTKHFFPQLRRSSVATIYFEIAKSSTNKEVEIEVASKSQYEESSDTPISSTTDLEVEFNQSAPLFALKTNLLYDCIMLPSIEIEVPIGDRLSIAGEWIFPWWTWDDGTSKSDRNRLQLLQGGLDVKYWLGNRSKRSVMTGWNVGLYCGAGKYDFEYNKKGYQGEFFIAAGVSGGFAHEINKSGSLRMEYALGIGYLKTDYRHYTSEFYATDDWRAILTKKGTYSWFGPTKAKISLVWLLNRKSKEGQR